MYRDVSASVAVYHHNLGDVRPLLEQIAMDPAVAAWVVVNNGGADEACAYARSLGARCLYPGRNLGYGSAHNLALRSPAGVAAPYHLILNPDISMKSGVLSELAAAMDELRDVGLLMPGFFPRMALLSIFANYFRLHLT